jgi:hypothetical protein
VTYTDGEQKSQHLKDAEGTAEYEDYNNCNTIERLQIKTGHTLFISLSTWIPLQKRKRKMTAQFQNRSQQEEKKKIHRATTVQNGLRYE